ncbi:MAG: hypothetical protein FJX25_18760 [Alphaproteobacteria bacterium]|nr:hypothetical protein [Alphaproteobacteria bacterium]
MSIHFVSPTSVADLAQRASAMLEEGSRLAVLASHLAEFEEATGRKLFVSEAEPGTSYVGQGTIRDRGPECVSVSRKVDPETDPGLTVSAAQDAPTAAEAPATAAPAAEKPNPQPEARQAAPSNIKKVDNAQPVSKQKPQQAERPWGKLNLAEREIVKHLEKLPRTFTTEEDLRLVELLTSGNKVGIAAAIMDVPLDQVLARWQAFLCPEVLGPNGKPSITGQEQLLNALRYRKDNPNA